MDYLIYLSLILSSLALIIACWLATDYMSKSAWRKYWGDMIKNYKAQNGPEID